MPVISLDSKAKKQAKPADFGLDDILIQRTSNKRLEQVKTNVITGLVVAIVVAIAMQVSYLDRLEKAVAKTTPVTVLTADNSPTTVVESGNPK